MTKKQFLDELERGLSGIPKNDIYERTTFYSEMIDDRMEDGLSEEEAVAGIGPVEDIVKQVLSETPLTKIVKERITPKQGLKPWQIVFLVLGFPVWFPLLIAFFAIVFFLYVVIWSVITAFWAAFAVFIGVLFVSLIVGIIYAFLGRPVTGLSLISAALVLAGLSIFWFFICKASTKGAAILSKNIALGIKHMFVGRNKN